MFEDIPRAVPTGEPYPIECAGSHEDMGRIQGVACRGQLLHIDRVLFELLGVPQTGYLRAAVGPFTSPTTGAIGRLGRRLVWPALERTHPDQAFRLRGIALGAGLPLHWLLVGPVMELALNRSVYRMPQACTAFAVTGQRSSRGEPMIGKNFDYPPASNAMHLTRRSRPSAAGRAASLEVTKAPLAGSHEGINEHGLAVVYNYGSFRGRAAARVSVTFLVQHLLEHCHTVEEAIARMRDLPRAGGALLMLADATGDIAAVELAPDALAVRRGDSLVHANHARTAEIAERDVPEPAVFPRWMRPVSLRGRRVRESSEERQGRAEQLLDQIGSATADDLADILCDHGADSRPSDNTICRHGPYYSTTCSVILFPVQRAMRLLVGAPCQRRYVDLAL